MSCNPSVVPDFNCDFNSGGVQSITAGTGITITGTATVPVVSSTANQTQAFGNNTISVAVLTNASNSLSSVGFTTTGVSDIYASASVTVQTNSNIKYDNSFTLTIDGTAMSSGTFIDSIDGVGHYRTVTICGFRANLAAGSHTLRLTGLSSAPNGTMIISRITTTGLANLI